MRCKIPLCALAIAASALSPSDARAQRSSESQRFASPVRLMAGDKLLGERRLYPSPMYHDVNGDGRTDIVVGDLRGHITVALREAGDGAPRFGPESALQDAHGKDIDFHNW